MTIENENQAPSAEQPNYSFNDVIYDLGNLKAQMWACVNAISDLEAASDEQRNEIDRVSSLVRIAEELTEKILNGVEDNYRWLVSMTGSVNVRGHL